MRAGEALAPGPVRVAVVDVDAPPGDLDCTRLAAPPYSSAWILACRGGRPLGRAEIPLADDPIPAQRLGRELRRQLGDAWERQPYNAANELAAASVVVTTNFARPAQLRRCIESLRALDYPEYEVIVVDNREFGAAIPLDGVRLVHEPRPGISAARNRGLLEATGEFVAFTDDDVEVDGQWLRALSLRFARQPEVVAVTGLVVPRELETPAQIWFEQSGNLQRSFDPLTFQRAAPFGVLRRELGGAGRSLGSLYAMGEFGAGSNMAFRTSALRAAGGFDRALGVGTPTHGGEDLAMLVELLASGRQLAYEPTAIAHHTHRRTVPELERQIYGYGVAFTAMLTAIALRNPRHLVGLAAVIPAWLRSLRDPASAKRAGRTPDYPAHLGRAELRGMLAGPLAYIRSQRMQKRWVG